MLRWPSLNEMVTVETWVRPAEGAFAVRDFRVRDVDGALIGEATTSWLLLNATTRKPLRETLEGYEAGTDRISFDCEKLHAREECQTLARFEVRNSDIDGNKHVNNTRYSQWILDAIPIEWHSQYLLRSYSVNFLAETHLGDAIDVQSVRGAGESFYQGRRVSDGKVVFTASLHTTPIV